MSPDTQVLLSGGLTFGVPLLIAVRELVGLRRGNGEGSRRAEPVAPEPPLPRPLPACLVPPLPRERATASRPRVLEPT